MSIINGIGPAGIGGGGGFMKVKSVSSINATTQGVTITGPGIATITVAATATNVGALKIDGVDFGTTPLAILTGSNNSTFSYRPGRAFLTAVIPGLVDQDMDDCFYCYNIPFKNSLYVALSSSSQSLTIYYILYE